MDGFLIDRKALTTNIYVKCYFHTDNGLSSLIDNDLLDWDVVYNTKMSSITRPNLYRLLRLLIVKDMWEKIDHMRETYPKYWQYYLYYENSTYSWSDKNITSKLKERGIWSEGINYGTKKQKKSEKSQEIDHTQGHVLIMHQS